MDVGDLVRISPNGTSIFRIEGVDEEDPDRVIVKSIDENAPGVYPFSSRRHELIPHEESGQDGT
ncbi:hypothetical protein GS481_02810 [Rhodococcus hoagii]|nr:hypothetical protein [Prescottella equi]